LKTKKTNAIRSTNSWYLRSKTWRHAGNIALQRRISQLGVTDTAKHIDSCTNSLAYPIHELALCFTFSSTVHSGQSVEAYNNICLACPPSSRRSGRSEMKVLRCHSTKQPRKRKSRTNRGEQIQAQQLMGELSGSSVGQRSTFMLHRPVPPERGGTQRSPFGMPPMLLQVGVGGPARSCAAVPRTNIQNKLPRCSTGKHSKETMDRTWPDPGRFCSISWDSQGHTWIPRGMRVEMARGTTTHP